MKKLLIILFLNISLFAFGQTEELQLLYDAADLYSKGKYDSALVYYYKNIKDENSKLKYYCYLRIGDCLLHQNQKKLAKESLLYCLILTEKNNSDTNQVRKLINGRHCCHLLYDIYTSENQFDSALYYLRFAENKFLFQKYNNEGEFYRKKKLAYKFSICFAEMYQIDSIIQYLTPYIFPIEINNIFPIEINNKISTEFKEEMIIERFYLSIIKRKYSKRELRKLFSLARKSISYTKELDKEQKKYYPDENWYEVKCYFDILGHRIIFVDMAYEANSWGGEPVKTFSKVKIVNVIKKSLILKNLKNI